MKKITIFLLAFLTIALSVLVSAYIGGRDNNLTSPLGAQAKVLGANLWSPEETLDIFTDAPDVTAKSAIFVDSKTGQVLYAKNPHLHLPIASLTKVMTVLVSLDRRGLGDKFLVSNKAASMEPDKMWLIPGEKLTLKELLYGIFLVSANDGAETIAEDTTGSRADFISLMNSQATQLDMKDTLYINPTGLDEDNNSDPSQNSVNYSSAFDQAILTRYAIRRFPVLIDIASTYHIAWPKTSDRQDYEMYSGINLLTTYPGVEGFKTGYTPEAGLTLITLAEKQGHQIIGVLLGSNDRRDEARELLDYSFKKLGVTN